MITRFSKRRTSFAPRVRLRDGRFNSRRDLVRFCNTEDVAQIPKGVQGVDRHFFRANGLLPDAKSAGPRGKNASFFPYSFFVASNCALLCFFAEFQFTTELVDEFLCFSFMLDGFVAAAPTGRAGDVRRVAPGEGARPAPLRARRGSRAAAAAAARRSSAAPLVAVHPVVMLLVCVGAKPVAIAARSPTVLSSSRCGGASLAPSSGPERRVEMSRAATIAALVAIALIDTRCPRFAQSSE